MPAPEGSVVVPLDGSKIAERALPLAARLARGCDAPVAFVHVLDPDQYDRPGEPERAERAFRAYAEDLAKRHGIERWDAAVLGGHASEAVLEYAAPARWICVASHGRGGFKALLVGSVADKIVRGAEIPVFFVPVKEEQAPLPGPGHPVLVALDGSEEAERALALGREMGQLLGAAVALVRAYSVPPPVGVEFVAYSPELLAELEAAASAYLREVAREGEERYVVQGAPAEAIAEVADRIDAGLVVVATRGLGLARRLILGSTTDRLMRSLARPLLIVPPEA